ncbi:F0F1 ATP synthase subunit B' [Roseobacter sp. N2S]|uniref:F0F1 ATP synthase subunit B' n=1 Tax=Roseobacter sp. N2S TaxID=2663844 RepID=UPI0028578F7C|nr:F0F1 ATP synthase subunit B' [Roseobacter sp. N2S]MDR6264005.1 F-type H+-transporting ATPase subunit b [Roseobacter sp. N2S]
MATETHAAASEHAQGMPQLDFSTFPNQIFWLLVTLVVIYFVMSRVALPRIASVLAERHGAIQSDLDKAEQMKAKAVEAEAAYNKALVDARAEAQSIVDAARAEIQKEVDVAMAKADAEIAVKAAESETEIKAIRDSALSAIEEVANDTAVEIVNAVMPAAADAKAVKAAVTARLKG